MIANSRNVSEAQFSLIICAKQLDFESISKNVGFTPTKCIKNGEEISRLPHIVSQEDAWYYTIPLSNPEGSDSDLIKIFDRISAVSSFLKRLEKYEARITLRLSLTTDKAFMGCRLNPDTIVALQKTGFALDITTVSWGDVSF